MYDTHAMEISEHALKTPEGLTSVIRFTLCTIQQSLYSCENQIADIEKHGFKSRFLKNKMKLYLRLIFLSFLPLSFQPQKKRREIAR